MLVAINRIQRIVIIRDSKNVMFTGACIDLVLKD